MAQDSILGAPINLVGLSSKEKLIVEIAYSIGLNLPYFNMYDIYLETEMEINNAFASASKIAIDKSSLPESFNFVKIGNIMEDTYLNYLLNEGTIIGMYLSRVDKGVEYFLGRDLTTLKLEVM